MQASGEVKDFFLLLFLRTVCALWPPYSKRKGSVYNLLQFSLTLVISSRCYNDNGITFYWTQPLCSLFREINWDSFDDQSLTLQSVWACLHICKLHIRCSTSKLDVSLRNEGSTKQVLKMLRGPDASPTPVTVKRVHQMEDVGVCVWLKCLCFPAGFGRLLHQPSIRLRCVPGGG